MLVRYTPNHLLLWFDSSEAAVIDLDAQDSKLRELITEIRRARSKQRKLKTLLEKYENEYGSQAEKRVLEIIAEDTKNVWADIAEKREKNDIQGILDTLWSSFEQIGGEFTVERTEDSAQIHCTKCPMADMYLKIGKPELGLIFHCSTDPHIVAGFNPKMKFRITKRLMNGDSCCDHYYNLR
ncbi:MAG: hypothetical protein EAX87_14985 [Candidatus Thorarchaeota archaeon]|nr:hypothetical protein [Candidatus Thorarchaeota archaeon]